MRRPTVRNLNGLSARALCAGVGMALACCTAAHAQVPTDDCASAPLVGPITTTPTLVSGSTVGAAFDATFGTCVTTHTSPDVFFRVLGTGNRITVTTCDNASGGSADYDTKLSVYAGDCFAPICVTGNDDSCVGGSSTLRSTVTFCSDPGVEYIVMVHGFSAGVGSFTASVFDDGLNCSDPGACCFIDGSCIEVNSEICTASGGIFQGAGTDCGSAMCQDLTPSNNDCADATIVGSLPFFSSGSHQFATRSGWPGSCNSISAVELNNSVWYSYTPTTDCVLVVDVTSFGYDSLFFVLEGGCFGFEADCEDIFPFTGGSGQLVVTASAGVEYVIGIGRWGTSTAPTTGSYTIDIDCIQVVSGACCFGDGSCIEVNTFDCAAAGGTYQGDGTDCGTAFCPDLTGACCFIDGSCIQVLEAACSTSGGIFQGSGTDCGSVICPDLTPTNNECVDAIALTIDGSTSTGNTALATPSALPSDCSSTGGTASPGVWYSVIGNGTRLTATTCHGGSSYDTHMRVFEGIDCSTSVCIGVNDDMGSALCPQSGLLSAISWCSIPGQTYYIYVSGFSTASGFYEVGVTSDGINCADPGACCFNDGSCIDTIAESCESAGGVFQGGGTSCGTTTCPDLRIGACCLPGDVCVEVTDFDCSGLGGSFQGPNTVCDPAFANSSFPNIAIPDATPAGITDSIVVASSAAITSIEIALDISHTWIGDLLVTVDRNGVEVATLIGRPGVPPATFGDSSDLAGVYIFSDAGAIAIADAAFAEPGAIPPGTYQASDSNDLPVSLNSIFTNTQGTWTLFISDNAGGDTGTIRGWGIGFNGEVPVTICSTGPAPCPCDFNNNGLQEIGDYFSFLTAFFAQLGGPGSADFDGDGTVTIGDYFAFLACLPDIAASTACP